MNRSEAIKKAASDIIDVCEDNLFCAASIGSIIFRTVLALKPRTAAVTVPDFTDCTRALNAAVCDITDIMCDNELMALPDNINDIIPAQTDMICVCDPFRFTDKDDTIQELFNIRPDAVIITDRCISCKAFTAKITVIDPEGHGIPVYCLSSEDKGLIEKVSLCGAAEEFSDFSPVIGMDEAYLTRERGYLTEKLENLPIKVFPSCTESLIVRTIMPLTEICPAGNITKTGDNLYRIKIGRHPENNELIRCLSGYFRSIRP